jgi:anti-sigma B factor antagonist
MQRISDVFRIQETGPLTVIAVNPDGVSDFSRVEQCRNELIPYLKKAECKVVRFDLEGIPFLASGVLGLLVSLRKIGVDIQFKNVAEHIVDVLRVTRLDEMIEVLPDKS